MTGIFQLILKAIGFFFKTIFWIISAAIRLAVFSVVYSLYIILGILLPTPFLLLFSFKGFVKKYKDFPHNSINLFFGFFPEIKKWIIRSKKIKIGRKKQRILKEYTFPASAELTDKISKASIVDKENCESCGTPYSDKMKEISKKGENLFYCEYCGAEI
jgi:hypothetical protein